MQWSVGKSIHTYTRKNVFVTFHIKGDELLRTNTEKVKSLPTPQVTCNKCGKQITKDWLILSVKHYLRFGDILPCQFCSQQKSGSVGN